MLQSTHMSWTASQGWGCFQYPRQVTEIRFIELKHLSHSLSFSLPEGQMPSPLCSEATDPTALWSSWTTTPLAPSVKLRFVALKVPSVVPGNNSLAGAARLPLCLHGKDCTQSLLSSSFCDEFVQTLHLQFPVTYFPNEPFRSSIFTPQPENFQAKDCLPLRNKLLRSFCQGKSYLASTQQVRMLSKKTMHVARSHTISPTSWAVVRTWRSCKCAPDSNLAAGGQDGRAGTEGRH